MHRMGHASMWAALIYQHATSERDREIAAGMDRRIAKAQPKPRKPTKTTNPTPPAKTTKGAKPTRKQATKQATRKATPDGTARATGTPMARKIDNG